MLTKEAAMATHTVDFAEFRGDLTAYLLESETPVTVTRDGEELGVFYPVGPRRSQAQSEAASQAHARLQTAMAANGVTEDDILQDFEKLRRQ